jgi:aldose 1-epimerase
MKRATALGVLAIAAIVLAVRASVARHSDAGEQNQATAPPQAVPGQQSGPVTIGGEPAVTLTRPRSLDANKPQFLQAVLLPGVGMNLFELKAYVPRKGDVDLISTTDLASAKAFLEAGSGQFGNSISATGSAFLMPYAGPIQGALSSDGKTISAIVDGHRLLLPANWHGPGAVVEAASVNGLLLTSKFQNVTPHNGPAESTVFTKLHAGNFGGQWLSDTDVTVGATLKDASLDVYVIAKNVGDQEDPIGIGFLPYFVIPSGDRKQTRLTIPADMRVLVNNHQDDFPTGRVVSVNGTAYDFTAPEGTALGNFSLDDCFTDLQHGDNDSNYTATASNEIIQLVDPAAKYGLRIRVLSQHIKAIQVYAPADKDFVAVSPQFNLPDPYARIWRGQDTGMVLLQPGKSVAWYVRLELFTPR